MRVVSKFVGLLFVLFYASFAYANERIVQIDVGGRGVMDMHMRLVDGFPVYRLKLWQGLKEWVGSHGGRGFIVLSGENVEGQSWQIAGFVRPGGSQWTNWTHCPSCFGLTNPRMKGARDIEEIGRRVELARRSVVKGEKGLYANGGVMLLMENPGVATGNQVMGLARKAARLAIAHDVRQPHLDFNAEKRLAVIAGLPSVLDEVSMTCGQYKTSAAGLNKERKTYMSWRSCVDEVIDEIDIEKRRKDYWRLSKEIKAMGWEPDRFIVSVDSEMKQIAQIWSEARIVHEKRASYLAEQSRKTGKMVIEDDNGNNIVVDASKFVLKGDVSEGLIKSRE